MVAMRHGALQPSPTGFQLVARVPIRATCMDMTMPAPGRLRCRLRISHPSGEHLAVPVGLYDKDSFLGGCDFGMAVDRVARALGAGQRLPTGWHRQVHTFLRCDR